MTDFAATIPNASPSMRLDHLARRPSEIDVINGQVVELSREIGLEAPYNETLCAMLCAIASLCSTDVATLGAGGHAGVLTDGCGRLNL